MNHTVPSSQTSPAVTNQLCQYRQDTDETERQQHINGKLQTDIVKILIVVKDILNNEILYWSLGVRFSKKDIHQKKKETPYSYF